VNTAVLVGINSYPDPANNLNGCINDITTMQGFLTTKAGFSAGNITLLTDAAATRAAIYTALQQMVANCTSGDHLVFHYSGHGCQMPEKDANGNTVAVHDAMCPYDFDWTTPHAITDSDFSTLFGNVPSGVHLSWISDSCYSGGYTKLFALYAGNVGRTIIKTIPPPPAVHASILLFLNQQKQPLSMRALAQTLSRVILFSACSATQEAMDAVINGTHDGAFTYYLMGELESANGLTETSQKVISGVGSALQQGGFSQTPELHGDHNLFLLPTI
jgi:hypothetical protein